MPSDVSIAKNYINKKEITDLNRIVNMYFDYAEMQAARGKAMHMRDWADKLNTFLKFSEHDLLTNAGKVSHEVAKRLAEKEFEKFRPLQDKMFKSDFDTFVEETMRLEKEQDEGKQK